MRDESTVEQLARAPTSETRIRLTLHPTSRGKIVGRHPAMRRVVNTIERVADTLATVLITGESGTGKELVVAALHDRSSRANGPLVTVDCGAIPENLVDAELFGHAHGASSGADAAHQGLVAAAEGGTLFLDEVGELPLPVQVKLLRLLQRREYTVVGDSRVLKSDVRIVAASNRDLEAEVAERRFREDLYYRLNVVPVALPALRDRADDIELLAMHFARTSAARSGREVVGFTPEALAALRAFTWPGNERSLENAIERAVLFAQGPLVSVQDLPEKVRQARTVAQPAASRRAALPDAGIDLRSVVEEYENQLIAAALARTNGNKNRAAQLLGLNRTTLVEMMKRKGL
jgi:sigma-54 specific flagellar transcriptional regulator A